MVAPGRGFGDLTTQRAARGLLAQARGVRAEAAAVAALLADGFSVLGQRLRTPSGEIDIVVATPDLLAFIEVKARPNLAEAAYALASPQRRRLIAAAAWLLAEHPEWARRDTRFDVVLVDAAGRVRRIADAFRIEAETV